MSSAISLSPEPEDIRLFVQAYFDAWKGADEQQVLDFFSKDAVLHTPTGNQEGIAAIRDGFVHPVMTGFPGNVHSIRNLAHAKNLAAVEWNVDAMHKGPFAGVEPTNREVHILGSSFYEYDFGARKIVGGRIYLDFGEMLRQIGAAA